MQVILQTDTPRRPHRPRRNPSRIQTGYSRGVRDRLQRLLPLGLLRDRSLTILLHLHLELRLTTEVAIHAGFRLSLREYEVLDDKEANRRAQRDQTREYCRKFHPFRLACVPGQYKSDRR